MADIIKNIFKDIESNKDKRSQSIILKKYKDINNIINNKRIVVIDPVTLQPIISRKSLPSKGNYMKYNSPTIFKKSLNLIKPSISQKKYSKHIKIPPVPVPKRINSALLKKPCPQGKIRNIKTGRCINEKSNKKDNKKGLNINLTKLQKDILEKIKFINEKRSEKKKKLIFS